MFYIFVLLSLIYHKSSRGRLRGVEPPCNRAYSARWRPPRALARASAPPSAQFFPNFLATTELGGPLWENTKIVLTNCSNLILIFIWILILILVRFHWPPHFSICIYIGDKIALRDATQQDNPKQRVICSTGTSIITTISTSLGFENNTSFDKQLCTDCIVVSFVLY